MFQVLLEVLKRIAQWVIDKILLEILKGIAREIGKQAVAILSERREEILLWLKSTGKQANKILREILLWLKSTGKQANKILREILLWLKSTGKQANKILREILLWLESTMSSMFLWLRRNPQVVGLCLVVCVATFAVVYIGPWLLTEPTLAAIGSAFML